MNRRTKSSLRAAASGAVVESLELRRLLSTTYDFVSEFVESPRVDQNMFGSSIATNGNLALIGAPASLSGGVGKAYLIDTTQPPASAVLQTFTSPTGVGGDFFGTAVAWVDGKIAISSPENYGGSPGGKVYIYDNFADATPDQILASPNFAGDFNGFGGAMTSIGTNLFVTVASDGLGQSAVVRFDTTTAASEVYTVNTPMAGMAIAALGSTILVTSHDGLLPTVAQIDPSAAGSIIQTFDNGNSNDFLFGTAITVNANSVFIGSASANAVYEFDAISYSPIRTFTAPVDAGANFAGFGFGTAIAVSGDKLLITDINADEVGMASGEAYVFNLSDGAYVAKVASPTQAMNEEFGLAAAGVGDGKFLVADPYDYDNGDEFNPNLRGAVYLFEPSVVEEPTGPSITEQNGVLFVVGSDGTDNITIVKNDLGGFDVTMGELSANYTGGTIVVHAGDGDDVIGVSSAVTANVEIHGGAGNDSMSGGAGNDILVGDDGDDVLYGHTGRDLLIGGSGVDKVYGEVEDDILIGCATVHDEGPSALGQIMAIWTSSTMTFEQRIATLESDLLAPGAIIDDAQTDTLTGRNGDDWFFSDGVYDVVTDQKNGDDLSFIPTA